MNFLEHLPAEMQEHLADLVAAGKEAKKNHNRMLRENRKQKKADAARFAYEARNKRFQIELFWSYKRPYSEQMHDLFDIEGIENAMKMFEEYRSIGHRIRLSKMQLYFEDTKVKTLNFKY